MSNGALEALEALEHCESAFAGYRYLSQDAEKYIETIRKQLKRAEELEAKLEVAEKALNDLLDDLKERAKWMHFEPQEGGTVLPCGNGVYIAAEKVLAQIRNKS